ncbi:hypothetical protein JB92DRAFT_420904 [Gautieria morchelliformis]|nr:hypothetical protein JB92DRAFT_420904 [Gautieria morchelliformis]
MYHIRRYALSVNPRTPTILRNVLKPGCAIIFSHASALLMGFGGFRSGVGVAPGACARGARSRCCLAETGPNDAARVTRRGGSNKPCPFLPPIPVGIAFTLPAIRRRNTRFNTHTRAKSFSMRTRGGSNKPRPFFKKKHGLIDPPLPAFPSVSPSPCQQSVGEILVSIPTLVPSPLACEWVCSVVSPSVRVVLVSSRLSSSK